MSNRESVAALVLPELLEPRDQWEPVDHLDPLELMVARYDFIVLSNSDVALPC